MEVHTLARRPGRCCVLAMHLFIAIMCIHVLPPHQQALRPHVHVSMHECVRVRMHAQVYIYIYM